MLERLVIENLGPIEKAEVKLSPLTVLLGANASGKTSVLRAFELFANLRHHPLELVQFGGMELASAQWQSIVHRGDDARAVTLSGWVSDRPEPDYRIRVGVDWDSLGELRPDQVPVPVILSDRLRDVLMSPEFIDAGSSAFKIRRINVSPRPQGRNVSIPATLDSFARSPQMAERLSDLLEFARSLGSARFFKPVGSALVVFTGDRNVWPAGEGFVDALAAWQNAHVEDFLKLEDALRRLFPHIRRVRILRSDGTQNVRALAFETARSKHLTPAELEADGVLTTLFLLWAAFSAERDGVLLLDDPEAGLHPHLVGQRVDFIRSLCSGTLTGFPVRVVVATQSVEFVRFVDISEVRIVEHSPDRGTLVRGVPQDETVSTLLTRFRRNVGELWYSGALGGLPESSS
jgi:predicted ATPase